MRDKTVEHWSQQEGGTPCGVPLRASRAIWKSSGRCLATPPRALWRGP